MWNQSIEIIFKIRQPYIYIYIYAYESSKSLHIDLDRQTYWSTNRETDGQTDKQTIDKQTNEKTETPYPQRLIYPAWPTQNMKKDRNPYNDPHQRWKVFGHGNPRPVKHRKCDKCAIEATCKNDTIVDLPSDTNKLLYIWTTLLVFFK